MSDKDDPKNTPDPSDDPEDKPDTGGDDKPDHKAEAEKWKALARKHEANAKKNAADAKKLKELEDADKTESEKAADRAAAAEKRAAEAESRALRLEVAAEKGLTPSQAKRLVGTSREELESDADELIETFGKSTSDDNGKKPPAPDGKPKESLKPGGSDPTDDEPDETDPRKLAETVPRSGF